MNDQSNFVRKGPPTVKDAAPLIPAGNTPDEMTSEDEIGESLAEICDNGDAVAIYHPSKDEPIMARIDFVHPKDPEFELDLVEPEPLPAGRLKFVAWLKDARFQFELNQESYPPTKGDWHKVVVPFPEKALVMNRRSTPRFETPLGSAFMASFVLNGRSYELQLYDFSSGGIAMRAQPRETRGLLRGRKLDRVRLELGPETVIIVDIEIRMVRTFKSFLLGEQVQIGCMFINVDAETQEEIDRLLLRMKTMEENKAKS
ncbi:PilZ domain-containing protein [Massilia endophytica]|uniref:PilZ domain-containing protein n=1 Tax=Massilia endophytica TaxID=2899220 RepID=UPI001E2A8BFB|nr:PilZ domain-containing protein [Massilia endophytica]UGQ48881.1 PilZ domain-containing protein [Massilia endophytica]